MLKLIFLFLLAINSAIASTEIYKVKHRSASFLLDQIGPLYAESAKFSAQDNQLIIRADTAVIDEIIALLNELDITAKYYQLRFSDSPKKDSTTYLSTGKPSAINNQRFDITVGEPLIVGQQEVVNELELLGPHWVKLDKALQKSTSIELSIAVITDKQLRLTYKFHTLKQNKHQMFVNTITLKLGVWQPLMGHQMHSATWSTRSADKQKLYVRIDNL